MSSFVMSWLLYFIRSLCVPLFNSACIGFVFSFFRCRYFALCIYVFRYLFIYVFLYVLFTLRVCCFFS